MNPSYANTILSISLRKASTGISAGEKDRTSAVLLQGSPWGEALPATTCPLNQKVKNRWSLIRATSSRSTRTFSPVSSQNSRTAASDQLLASFICAAGDPPKGFKARVVCLRLSPDQNNIAVDIRQCEHTSFPRAVSRDVLNSEIRQRWCSILFVERSDLLAYVHGSRKPGEKQCCRRSLLLRNQVGATAHQKRDKPPISHHCSALASL